MKLSILSLVFIPLVFFSCGQTDPNKEIDEGKIKGEIYESKEIGWAIEIPKDWKIISKDNTEANDQRGKDAIEKSSGQKFDTKGLKHLISFQKNKFNIFTSTSEPFIEEYSGEFQENCKALNQLLYSTFVDQGIKVDTSSGKEKIEGLEFNTFHTTIYGSKGQVILRQILYSRLINGFDFGVSINYNNEEDKKTMLDAWKRSKFKMK